MTIIWRWMVLGAMVLLMGIISAGVNRNVYSKAEVDSKLGASVDRIDHRLDGIEDDVEWLVQYLLESTGEGDVHK